MKSGNPSASVRAVRKSSSKASLSSQPQPAARLTPREWEIVRLIVEGKAPKEIAAELGSKPQTVYNQLHQLHLKLGVNDSIGVLRALQLVNSTIPAQPRENPPRLAAW